VRIWSQVAQAPRGPKAEGVARRLQALLPRAPLSGGGGGGGLVRRMQSGPFLSLASGIGSGYASVCISAESQDILY